jgi:putative ABC transport system substrate-binding protein
MQRRDLITLIGALATGWPVLTWAQQTTRPPVIGFMGAGTTAGWSEWTTAFQQRMRDLGWVEGRKFTIEFVGQKAVSTATP